MPSLSPTMSEGGIVEWHKKEGDEVSAGDLLCEIQTDKAVVGMEAEDDGILAKIIKPKDSKNIIVGDAIGMMADRSEDWRAVGAKGVPGTSVTLSHAVQGATKVADVSDEIVSAISEKTGHEKVGPAARLLLNSYGIQSSQVAHTGPHNTLMKSDVVKHISQSKLEPAQMTSSPMTAPLSPSAPTVNHADIPLTNMRQTIAKRLSASKSTIPHFYTTYEATIDNLLSLRASLKTAGVSVSLNDFVVAACAQSLRLVPEVNSRLCADGSIEYNDSVDISVAVASEAGLITPIVFGADILSLASIGSTIRTLAEKARHNKLQPNEFIGGTFTISNLGMFGIKEFTAIINAPQCAILAVGAGTTTLELDPTNADSDHAKVVTKMRFTLSADARVVDSATAARFLAHVKTYLDHPHLLVSESGSIAAAWGY